MDNKDLINELIESGIIDTMAGDMSDVDKAAAIELARSISDSYISAFEKLLEASHDPKTRAQMLQRFKTHEGFMNVNWETEGEELNEEEEGNE